METSVKSEDFHTMDYKNKIEKLLRLAESSNEHEAKAALAKARKLMAEHKIGSIRKENSPKTVENLVTDITWSKRRDPWVMHLASVISANICCKAYQVHERGKQTYKIAFIGQTEDLKICQIMFQYAFDTIQANIKKIKKRNKEEYSTKSLKLLCDSYGVGFAEGIEETFRRQNVTETGWGLVLVTPKEVENVFHQTITSRSHVTTNVCEKGYDRGYKHGKQLSFENKLESHA